MTKKDIEKTLEAILKMANSYKILWQNGYIKEGDRKSDTLRLFCYWVAQDELDYLGIRRVSLKNAVSGNTELIYVSKGEKYKDSAETAQFLADGNLGRVSQLGLLGSFKEALKEPLGEYLARKEVDKLVFDLD